MTAEDRVKPDRAQDESERKTIKDILRVGVHVLHIFDPKGESSEFSYSVGLWHSHKHPEFLIYGLKSDLRHAVINYLNAEIKLGRSFRNGLSAERVLPGFTVYFQALPINEYRTHLGMARWFYGGDEFPAVQMLWPTTAGIYPWDSDASNSLRCTQPVLTELPEPLPG